MRRAEARRALGAAPGGLVLLKALKATFEVGEALLELAQQGARIPARGLVLVRTIGTVGGLRSLVGLAGSRPPGGGAFRGGALLFGALRFVFRSPLIGLGAASNRAGAI